MLQNEKNLLVEYTLNNKFLHLATLSSWSVVTARIFSFITISRMFLQLYQAQPRATRTREIIEESREVCRVALIVMLLYVQEVVTHLYSKLLYKMSHYCLDRLYNVCLRKSKRFCVEDFPSFSCPSIFLSVIVCQIVIFSVCLIVFVYFVVLSFISFSCLSNSSLQLTVWPYSVFDMI